jgi:hypothetical protein
LFTISAVARAILFTISAVARAILFTISAAARAHLLTISAVAHAILLPCSELLRARALLFTILAVSRTLFFTISCCACAFVYNFNFLGFNDVGYNNAEVITPNIDDLAKSGIIFDKNYVQPSCSPSRSALLTGMYPYKIGRQVSIDY